MTEVLSKIRAARRSMSRADAQVARVVLADPPAAINATVADLATQADVSTASVVRFARSLGFSGLPELRIALAQELSRQALELERSNIAEGEINASDSLSDIIAKLAFHEARSIEETARVVDQTALDQVAQAIASGRPVIAFGVGASGLVAADLAQKLQRIGLNCQFNPDTHVQLVHAAVAPADAVVIALSFSGYTAEVHRALTLAADRGAFTVAVSSAPSSPIGRAADTVLLTPAREAQFRAGALASRLCQLALIDFLFVRVAQLCFDDVEVALRQTRAAVAEQHLPGHDGEPDAASD